MPGAHNHPSHPSLELCGLRYLRSTSRFFSLSHCPPSQDLKSCLNVTLNCVHMRKLSYLFQDIQLWKQILCNQWDSIAVVMLATLSLYFYYLFYLYYIFIIYI